MSFLRPTSSDFFPGTRRGHSTGAASPVDRWTSKDKDGNQVEHTKARPFRCLVATCRGNGSKSGEHHKDQLGNMDDWRESVGLPVSLARQTQQRRSMRDPKRTTAQPYTGPASVLVWSVGCKYDARGRYVGDFGHQVRAFKQRESA